MKEKIKTTSFWLGVAGAVLILIESVADIFNVTICSETIETIVVSICSILVLLGIITKKNVSDTSAVSTEDLLMEFDKLKEDDND